MEVAMRIYPLLPLLFSLMLISGCFTPKKAVKNPLICADLDSLIHDYAQESERVMAAIRAEFGISVAFWNRYMDDFKALVANDNLLGPKPVKVTSKQLIPRLLEEYGINKKRVRLMELEGNNQAEAFQDVHQNYITHRLGINYKWLKTRPICEQEAILRHEIQHLLNYDSIEEMYIRWVLTDLGYAPKDWKNSKSMTDYYHLRELRADAFACGHQKKVAQSLHDYFCDTMSPNEDDEHWYSHPKDSVRAHQLAYLHNLNSAYSSLA
jgi:hypothetical protein